MAQKAKIHFTSDDPNDPARPPVSVNGRLAEIIYKLLLATEDIVGQERVNVAIQCWDKHVVVEVVRRY